MSLVFPVLVATILGLGLGGSVRRLSQIQLVRIELFYAAVAFQILAFPFPFLPWRTPETAAKALWLVSYALVLTATWCNRRLTGVAVVALGTLLNLVAVLANGGLMPALPSAVHASGNSYHVANNSITAAQPHLAALVDRWAAPDWIPLANVFSVGDVVIGLGAAVIVLAGMGVSLGLGRGTAQTALGPGPAAAPTPALALWQRSLAG